MLMKNLKTELRGILGARYIFAVPKAGQDWKLAVLKDGMWYSITYEQLGALYASEGAFYNDTAIPPEYDAQYYIAVPKVEAEWPAPAAILDGQKWRPITQEELRELAGGFSNLPANIQRGFDATSLK